MELLEEVKRYGRIDFDDDDGMIENTLIPSAQAYVTSATGITDYETDPRVRLLICVLVKDWYEYGLLCISYRLKEVICSEIL